MTPQETEDMFGTLARGASRRVDLADGITPADLRMMGALASRKGLVCCGMNFVDAAAALDGGSRRTAVGILTATAAAMLGPANVPEFRP